MLRVLPVTIHLKTLQHGCYAWCYALRYACYALPFLLYALIWPLCLPNINVTTKLSRSWKIVNFSPAKLGTTPAILKN